MLPNTYLQLEYIESTGTQYIDTLYMPNKNTYVYCRGGFTTLNNDIQSFGIYNGANQRLYVPRYNGGDNYYRICVGSFTATSNVMPDTNIHTFTNDSINKKYTIDNNLY